MDYCTMVYGETKVNVLEKVYDEDFINDGELIIPNYINDISDKLSHCKKLKKLVLPETITILNYCALEGCSNLETIVFPDNFSLILDGVFVNCEKLVNIQFPSNANLGGELCYYGCKSLKEIRIPNRESFIKLCCFKNCTSLENIIGFDNIDYIEDYAFENCTSLPSEMKLPKRLQFIGNGSFLGCTNIKKVYLPRYTRYCKDSFEPNVQICFYDD